jgi:hypothetical protein
VSADAPPPNVVDECRRRTDATIAREGAFRIRTRVGAFVCH